MQKKAVLRLIQANLLFLLVVASPTAVIGGQHIHNERWYQDMWCKGAMEYVLPDGARVDCLTEEYAIEVEFAPKWAESIGQSVYYATQTGRKPGVLLIMERKSDIRYLKRLESVVDEFEQPIRVWTIGPGVNCE